MALAEELSDKTLKPDLSGKTSDMQVKWHYIKAIISVLCQTAVTIITVLVAHGL
jgi:hypothetical protein